MRCLKNTLIRFAFFLLAAAMLHAQPVRTRQMTGSMTGQKPFPQHVRYGPGILLPDQVSRRQMDDSVRSFYDAWKKRYIRKGCDQGQYYVWFEGGGEKYSVSEGQGYGMIIVAMMAGYDPSAKTIFDGLFHYYRAHPSKRDPRLMAWAQKKGCLDLDGSSATDGDMDIAYSLLLANAQWGGGGGESYLEEARPMITAIMKHEINHVNFSALLSNSVEVDSKDYSDTRSSDFMPDHFRAFRQVSGDKAWDKAIDNNYRLFRFMQDRYSPEAGLLPDFIRHIGMGSENSVIRASPARPHYLESRYDGCFYYNACRIPWRIAADRILNGDPRAATIADKINGWIRSTTRGNPDNISAGYSLGGNDLPRHYFEALSFITPFAVSAMVGRSGAGDHGNGREAQIWLNKLWDYIVRFRVGQFDYYDNSIKMIGMITISGNCWGP
jgi:endo-1,4-beta-D-glucanase Y